LGGILKLLIILLHLFLEGRVQIRINTQELDSLVLLLHLADKGAVNIVGKEDSVDALALKEVDILTLLLLVGHIEDGVLMLLLVLLQAVLKGQIFAFQILKEDVISHLLRKFLVLNVAKLDE